MQGRGIKKGLSRGVKEGYAGVIAKSNMGKRCEESSWGPAGLATAQSRWRRLAGAHGQFHTSGAAPP